MKDLSIKDKANDKITNYIIIIEITILYKIIACQVRWDLHLDFYSLNLRS